MILVKIPGLGDPQIGLAGYDDGHWFAVDSFSFGIERELKRTGEKGGTADINIGVGELRPLVVTKRLDPVSAPLAQLAVNGNSFGTLDLHVVTVGGSGNPVCHLAYRLDRGFVLSWSTSGDADDRPTEEVAFHYNRLAFGHATTSDGETWEQAGTMGWDLVKARPWKKANLAFAPDRGFI